MTPLLLVAALAGQPPELGLVQFRRGFGAALSEARERKLPLLVLFDEIPGCATVNAFGDDVLGDVVVKDALETLFVPVLVQNNASGDDADVLARFREPAWNNPVVRVLDGDGADLVPRLQTPTRADLLRALVDARTRAHLDVPAWLDVVANESQTATKTFRCWCFWEGEAHLGARDGVVSTEAGFVDGHEAVRVTYDPAKERALDDAAARDGYAPVNGTFTNARGDDDKHALARSRYANVEMSAAQRTKVNAAIAAGRDPSRWLSPTQLHGVAR